MSLSSPRLTKTAFIVCLLLLMLFMGVGRGAIAADWPDMRVVGPFVCRADFSLKGLEPFLNELGQLQNDLAQALGIAPAGEAIEVYLLHDRQTYERYLKQHYPNVPFRRAVYIKDSGPGRVFAYRSEQFQLDLRHECTHALLHASLKTIPLWLDEGLAGYFELAPDQRTFDNPHLSSIRWNVWLGIIPRIENLEKFADIEKMGKAGYRDSWAWVHFMLHGPVEAHEELVHFLRDLNTQKTTGPLSQRLEQRISLLQQSFALHFKKWKKAKMD